MSGMASVPNTQLPTTGQTTPASNPFGSNPFMGSTNPYIQAAQQTAQGNIQSAQAATAANRVNQATPYGNLQYSQTGTDANGNPIWSANQTLSPELQNLTQQSLQNLRTSLNNPAYGVNAGQTATDAIMSRLQPQIQHQNEVSDQQLANQGILPGTEAYNRAKTQLAQQQNDLLTSAQTAGINAGLNVNQAQNQTAANIRSLANQNYVNPYNQATVSGPDYTGAYTTSQAAQIAQQNADAAKQAALTGGLFQLGGSVLSNPTATNAISSGLGGIFNAVKGLF